MAQSKAERDLKELLRTMKGEAADFRQMAAQNGAELRRTAATSTQFGRMRLEQDAARFNYVAQVLETLHAKYASAKDGE